MPVTTHHFNNIGSPPDDPTCPLPATMYIPDETIWPPPHPCFIGAVSGLFSEGGPALDPVMTDLANAGFLCLFGTVRRMTNLINGQTTDGKYHQQTDDEKIMVRFMRANPGNLGYSVTGWVGAIGGSAGAYNALWMALDGTPGDDKANAAICMSPVTDMSNRDTVSNLFTTVVRKYGRTDGIQGDNLPLLLSESPLALNLASASPVYHLNGDDEQMPLTEFTRFKNAMISAGARNYVTILNTGAVGRLHSFNMWPFIKDDAIAWAQNAAGFDIPYPRMASHPNGGATFSGDISLLGDLTGQNVTATGAVSAGTIGSGVLTSTASYLTLTAGVTPGTPVGGMIFAKASDHHLYYYSGSAWV